MISVWPLREAVQVTGSSKGNGHSVVDASECVGWAGSNAGIGREQRRNPGWHCGQALLTCFLRATGFSRLAVPLRLSDPGQQEAAGRRRPRLRMQAQHRRRQVRGWWPLPAL